MIVLNNIYIYIYIYIYISVCIAVTSKSFNMQVVWLSHSGQTTLITNRSPRKGPDVTSTCGLPDNLIIENA